MGDITKSKPLKQSEKIDKMYYAIFGMNGADGLLRKMDATEAKVDGMHKKFDLFLESRLLTCPLRNDQQAKVRRTVAWIIALAGWAALMLKLFNVIQ